MKAAFAMVSMLVLAWSSEAVWVQENGMSFPLEAVKRLQKLTELRSGAESPRLRASSWSLCDDPLLPADFKPLCDQRGASASMSRLAMVPMDICEICAFAACTGC
ncbi:guanylate cyclase activator 2B [Synchiropus picturatus]